MAIQLPPIHWPAVLNEVGPSNDPSVLLEGTAHFAGKEMQIVAIRVDPIRHNAPDYRRAANKRWYRSDPLDAVLGAILDELDCIAGDLSDFLGEDRATVLTLEGRTYVVWMMPATFHI